MSQAEAERYIFGMNSAPRGSRALILWRLTAPDAELSQAIRSAKGQKATFAVHEVWRRRKPDLFKEVQASLMKGDQDFALAAVALLAKFGGAGSRESIQKACRHPVPQVRWHAARIASAWGYSGSRESLREAVKEGEILAILPLSLVGSSADICLIRDLAKRKPAPDQSAKTNILVALTRLGDAEALKRARSEIWHPSDRWLRAAVLPALASRKNTSDLPLFILALKDPEMRVRFAAAEALGSLGAKQAVDPLRLMSKTPGPDAKNAGTNEPLGRKYAAYVADCLERNQKPESFRDWRQQNWPRPMSMPAGRSYR